MGHRLHTFLWTWQVTHQAGADVGQTQMNRKCLLVRPAKDQSRYEIIEKVREMCCSDTSVVHPRSNWLSSLLFHLQKQGLFNLGRGRYIQIPNYKLSAILQEALTTIRKTILCAPSGVSQLGFVKGCCLGGSTCQKVECDLGPTAMESTCFSSWQSGRGWDCS